MFNFLKKNVVKSVRVIKPSLDECLSVISEHIINVDKREGRQDAPTGIFREMSNIEGIDEYLRETLNNDIARYFNASDDKERDMIRGAFFRTTYILNKVREHRLDNSR